MHSPRSSVLRGVALHRGGPAEVRLTAAAGPLTLAQRGDVVEVADLRVVRADRGVTLASTDGRVRVDLVEHLFAALAGLGVGSGVQIAIDDDELPLLDGGARRFAEAILALDLVAAMPPDARVATMPPDDHVVATPPGARVAALPPRALVVTRRASIRRGNAVYDFAPGPTTALRVDVDFRAPVGRESAEWHGDAKDFLERIAPARTFGWADEHAALRASGRAAAVDLDAVLVFDERGAIPGCRPAGDREVARHKLLDLIGDLAIHGGPLRGSITASQPGHAATHAVVADALASGLLRRSPS